MWTCSSRTLCINNLISKVQTSLFSKLIAKNANADLTAIKDNPIWSWRHSNQFVGGFLFTRGIVPSSLVSQISLITSNQELTFGLIAQLHDQIMELFISDIWIPRNEKLQTFEESLSITPEKKKQSCSTTDLSYTKPILGPQH